MRSAWIVASLLAVACGSSSPNPQQPAATPTPAVHVGNRPPTPKDVIDAVLSSASVSLNVSPTCRDAGTESTDTTIGRYLAGFMAEMSSDSTTNWIETRITEGKSPGGEAAWLCTMTLRHRDAEDRWGWGVQFAVRQSDGLVIGDSFICTGAG